MKFLIAASVIATLLGCALAWMMYRASRGSTRATKLALFRGMLLLACVPHALHVQGSYGWSTGWVDLTRSDLPYGRYPGAVAFLICSMLLIVLLLGAATLLASRLPLAAALLPALLFTAYYLVMFRILHWRAPGNEAPLLDNMPNVWLFVVSTAATALLLMYAALALRKATRPST